MAQVPPSDIFTRRVCLHLEGMEAVTVDRDLAYGSPDPHHRFDLYHPPASMDEGRRPAVIIVSGYPGNMEPRRTPLAYKDIGWTVSMCQLLAMSGMVAIAYTNRDPAADARAMVDHIHEHAASLRIDPARIGVMAVSGNVPTALTTIMQEADRPPACAVFAYGCLLDLEGATNVADTARQFGFANPVGGRTIADLRRDVPLLVARAGRDQFPGMNASLDRFIRLALIENLPISVVNHAEGQHAFDLFDDTPASRDVVRQELRFFQQHLMAASGAAQGGSSV